METTTERGRSGSLTDRASSNTLSSGIAAPHRRRQIRLIWRSLALIAIASAIAGGLVYLAVSRAEPTYRATTKFAIVPNATITEGAPADLVESVAALDRPIVNATVSELLQSGLVMNIGAATAGIAEDDVGLYDLDAAEVPGSAVVRLHVTGPDSDRTAALASAIRSEAPDDIPDYIGAFEIRSIDQGQITAHRLGPNPQRDAIAASMAVALLGIAVAFVFAARREFKRGHGSPSSRVDYTE